MPSGMEADSVLARAEDAIRRARRLTTAYSDIWTEQQEELAQQQQQAPLREPSVPLPGSSADGAGRHAADDLPGRRSASGMAEPAAATEPRDAAASAESLATLYGQSLLEAYVRGRASGSAAGGGSGLGELTAGLPRVQALLSALMRARMQQPQPDAEAQAEARQPPPRAALQPTGSSFDSIGSGGGGMQAVAAPAHVSGSRSALPDGCAIQLGHAQGPASAAGGSPAPQEGGKAPEGGGEPGGEAAADTMQPILAVAQRLAALQRQQSDTLQQLLRLRLEQLRLRQQQLAALQCLLRTEAACIEGSPLQLSAVQQAVDLLSDSLEDVHAAAAALQWGGEQITHAAAVAASVSEADARAEEVSAMARQLLAALRRHPNRHAGGSGGDANLPLRGATPHEIARHPVEACTLRSAHHGDTCSICLSTFQAGDDLRGLGCPSASTRHFFHRACIDEWLGIRGCCPLCKFEVLDGGGGDGAAQLSAE